MPICVCFSVCAIVNLTPCGWKNEYNLTAVTEEHFPWKKSLETTKFGEVWYSHAYIPIGIPLLSTH